MTLIMPDDNVPEFDFDIFTTAENTVRKTLSIAGFDREAEVSLSFVTKDEIKDLNKTYREVDSVTDVLSFPLIDFGPSRDYEKILSLNETESINPDTGEVMLGDIVVCEEKIVSQAAEYGHSVKREFAFLLCHSTLHLIGFDHIKEDERTEMEAMQKKIMEELSITK